MRKRDIRKAVQIDHHRAWLYTVTPGQGEPEMFYVYSDAPRQIRRIIEDYETRHVKADREHHIADFYRSMLDHLADATEIVLFGPGQAKDELTNWIRDEARFNGIIVRTFTTEWLSEKDYETFLRDKLRLGDEVPMVFHREGRFIPHRRMGGPGAPVDPADYRRTADVKNNPPSAREP